MATVVIIGGGSSVKSGIKQGLWDRIKHLDIIACNDAITNMPFTPKYVAYIDKTPLQPEVIKRAVENPNCIKITQLLHDLRADDHNVVRFKIFHDIGEPGKFKRALERGYLFAGKRKFTGVFAISFALYAGYDRIYLLGFDWNTNRKGDVEWYKDKDHEDYKRTVFLDTSGAVRDDCALHHDVFKGWATIYNVSPNSAIPSFPKIDYKQFFQHISHLKEEG